MVHEMIRPDFSKELTNFQFQLQHVKSLDILTTALSIRKSWTNDKSVTFLGPIRELKSLGKLSPGILRVKCS